MKIAELIQNIADLRQGAVSSSPEDLASTVVKLCDIVEALAEKYENHVHRVRDANTDPYNPFSSYTESEQPEP